MKKNIIEKYLISLVKRRKNEEIIEHLKNYKDYIRKDVLTEAFFIATENKYLDLADTLNNLR